MMFFLKYWRAILSAALVGSTIGYLWYTSAKIDRLSLENKGLKTTIEASRMALEELEADKLRVDTILQRNAVRERERASEMGKLRSEISKLKESSNEITKECYTIDIGNAVYERLHNKSKSGD